MVALLGLGLIGAGFMGGVLMLLSHDAGSGHNSDTAKRREP